MSDDGTTPKRRKRADGKVAKAEDGKPTKLTLYLAPDLAKRFGVHAMMVGMDRSELFADMVRTHCKRFVVSDRSGGQGADTEATDAA